MREHALWNRLFIVHELLNILQFSNLLKLFDIIIENLVARIFWRNLIFQSHF